MKKINQLAGAVLDSLPGKFVVSVLKKGTLPGYLLNKVQVKDVVSVAKKLNPVNWFT